VVRSFYVTCVLVTVFLTGFARAGSFVAEERLKGPPWPAEIKGHVPVKPGEHPRLLFRKTDLPELRRRAETPEGKMIIKRLRYLLNGSDGESMTTVFSPATCEYPGGNYRSLSIKTPGVFTMSHAAGYGFLYQLTGDKKYAEYGKQCFIKGLDEAVRDRDSRYALFNTGALRAGPAMTWYALGYDLCYDGWDPDFRRHVCMKLLFHDGGNANIKIEALAQGRRHHPACNHWGGQISGPAMLALATMGDPEANEEQVQKLLKWGEQSTLRQLTEGIGDYGFFGGGTGPGVITTDTAFLPLLQAWKTAAGKDFLTPRPVGEWLSLKWIFGCVPLADGGTPLYPVRGTYSHNYFSGGSSRRGTFGMGFGTISEKYRPALLWLYSRSFEKADLAAEQPYGSCSVYPHQSIIALANWPFGMKEGNPGKVLPRMYLDEYWDLAEFRSGWTGPDDIVISALLNRSGGHYRCMADTHVIYGGRHHVMPVTLKGQLRGGELRPRGWAIRSDDGSLAVDFNEDGSGLMLVWANAKSLTDGYTAEKLKKMKGRSKPRFKGAVHMASAAPRGSGAPAKLGVPDFAKPGGAKAGDQGVSFDVVLYGGSRKLKILREGPRKARVGARRFEYDGKFVKFVK